MIMSRKREITFLVVLGVLFICSYVSAANNSTMTVEANIFASDEGSQAGISFIVPDYIYLGNVSIGECSDSVKFYINNTGSSKINIVPKLKEENEKIFSWLYFKEYGEDLIRIFPFGNFSSNITAKDDRTYYVRLNLTDAENIENNMIGHKADVVFWAVAA